MVSRQFANSGTTSMAALGAFQRWGVTTAKGMRNEVVEAFEVFRDLIGCGEFDYRVVDGDAHDQTDLHFQSDDGALLAGSWTSTAGRWHAFIDRDESCYIVYGHCQLIDEAGNAKTFRSGDAFLISNGFRGYWNIIEETRKHLVIRNH